MDPAGLSIKGLIIMYLGFFGYLGSAILFIFQGFDREGKVCLRKAVFWFISIFVFFILWILGLILL
jgi:hypothetical protein